MTDPLDRRCHHCGHQLVSHLGALDLVLYCVEEDPQIPALRDADQRPPLTAHPGMDSDRLDDEVPALTRLLQDWPYEATSCDAKVRIQRHRREPAQYVGCPCPEFLPALAPA